MIFMYFLQYFQAKFVRATETVPEMAFAIQKPEFATVHLDSMGKDANVRLFDQRK
jgi:hypothetical protein